MAPLKFHHLVVLRALRIGRNPKSLEPSSPCLWGRERFFKELAIDSVRYSKQHGAEGRHPHPLDGHIHEERFPLIWIRAARPLVHGFEERSERSLDAREQFLECD